MLTKRKILLTGLGSPLDFRAIWSYVIKTYFDLIILRNCNSVKCEEDAVS